MERNVYYLHGLIYRIFLIALVSLFATFLRGQRYEGNLYITSQTQMDELSTRLQGSTTIHGNLYIGSTSLYPTDPIDDLSPLSNIDTVLGDLLIGGAYDGGSGTLTHYNRLIPSLSNLGKLAYVEGDLRVQNTRSLLSLDLDALNYVEGSFSISYNSNLDDLSSLDSLTFVGKDVTISKNDKLVSLSGLDSLVHIGGNFTVNLHPLLQSLKGLESLASVGGNLKIEQNSFLFDYCALRGLLTVGGLSGSYEVRHNFYDLSRTDLQSGVCSNGPSDYIYIGDLYITTQTEMNNLVTDLQGKTVIAGSVYIGSTFMNGDPINSLSPLTNIDSITGHLKIGGEYQNRQGVLNVNSNPLLKSLTGLDNLIFVGQDLSIESNSLLYDFCALSSLSTSDGVQGTETVTNNLYNPSLNQMKQNNQCSDIPPAYIYFGDLYITNQAQMDELLNTLKDKTTIKGDIYIGSTSSSEQNPIVSLSPFMEIDTIIGKLYIGGYYKGVSGSTTHYNPSLTSLEGLNSLRFIDGQFFIKQNSRLKSLVGLDNLAHIGDNLLTIWENDSLSSLSGIGGLDSLNIQIVGNDALKSLNGLEGITKLISLQISNNDALEALSGLDGLTEISNKLVVMQNSALKTLNGLENLTVSGEVNLSNNPLLYDFCALSTLVTNSNSLVFKTLANYYNPTAFNMKDGKCIKPSPQEVYLGDIYITTQLEMNALDVTLKDKKIIQGNLYVGSISENSDDPVTDFSPLRRIDSIMGSLYIGGEYGIGNQVFTHYNPLLSLLSGLDSLVYIRDSLVIQNNAMLTSLDGLDSLGTVQLGVTISDNDILHSFCAFDKLMNVQGFTGKYRVEKNLYNPLLAQLKSGECIGMIEDFVDISLNTSFGDVAINTAKENTLSIVNKIIRDVRIDSIKTPQGYSVSEKSFIVSASGTKNIALRFSPMNTVTYSGDLIIYTPYGHDTLTLSGKGISREFTVSTNSISLPDIIKGKSKQSVLTITSTGNRPLRVDSLTLPNTIKASWEKGDVSSTQDITFTITPIQEGSYSEEIVIHTNGTVEEETSVSVTATVLPITKEITLSAFARLDNVALNTVSNATLTIQNTGNSPLTVSSVTSSNPAFQPSFSGSVTVDPSSSKQITVSFTPTAEQHYTTTITVQSDADNGTLVRTISLSGQGVDFNSPDQVIDLSGDMTFGEVDFGVSVAKTIEITNSGSVDIRLTGVASSNSDFKIDFTNNVIIPKDNGSINLQVTYTPSTRGDVSSTLELVLAGSTSDTLEMLATGFGVEREITLSGDLDFGKVPLLALEERRLIVTNNGNSNLEVIKIVLPIGYTTSTKGLSLPKGESAGIRIKFLPREAISYNNEIEIVSNAHIGESRIGVTGVGYVPYKPVASSFSKVFVTVLSESCPKNNDGQIKVANNEQHSIVIQLNDGEERTIRASDSLTYDRLESGEYNLLMKEGDRSKLMQLIITEPQVSGIEVATSQVYGLTKSLNLSIAGGEAPYDVRIGDQNYTSYSKDMVIDDLSVGLHSLQVSDQSCNEVYTGHVYVLGDFKYYPNPVVDKLLIVLPEDEEALSQEHYTVQILNNLGALVLTHTMSHHRGKLEVPFERLSQGVYFVAVNKSDGTPLIRSIKVVKRSK